MSLEVDRLSVWYGEARALWEVSLHVGESEVVGILGRNGAGKTTLLRALGGFQSRMQGDIRLGGQPLDGLRPDRVAKRGVSFLREGARLPGSLTVLQLLTLSQRLAKARRQAPRSIREIWELFPLLEPLQSRPAALLSGGQRQAASLACAFISAPTLLLLDEPSAGLAPMIVRDLFATIERLAHSGLAVLVVEQSPDWLVGFAERAYLLEVGRIIDQGAIADVMDRAGVSAMT
jgi:branched-chain amino acid transport system ATP-binding protein